MADWFPWFGICGSGICWLLPAIIWIVLAVWVYKDAESRGDSNAVLWLIVVLILGIIGLIIYLVVRKDKPQQQYYQPPPQQPQYQQAAPPPVPAQQQYNCAECGAPMRYIQNYQRWYCDHCGRYQ